jgi:hypothetical protein
VCCPQPPAPAPVSTNETPVARVARLRAELRIAQTQLDAQSPPFPDGWAPESTASTAYELAYISEDGEKIRACGDDLCIVDADEDNVSISLAAVRAFLARLG